MKIKCINCNQIVGSRDLPLELIGGKVLCRDCADQIIYDINKIYAQMPKDQFEKVEEKIIKYCQEHFSHEVTLVVMDTVYDKYAISIQDRLCMRDEEKYIVKLKQLEKEKEDNYKKSKIAKLQEKGLNGYYEFKVVNLFDGMEGAVCTQTMETTLNQLGLEGWCLKCAYSNVVGVNSNSSGFMGVSAGTNSTVDQNILIFERFVRFD